MNESTCENFGNFLRLKSKHIIIITILIQCLVSIAFFIIYLFSNTLTVEFSINYKLYLASIILIFLGFMVHFAYHSLSKAYVIELIAFLAMATIQFSICFFIFIKSISVEYNRIMMMLEYLLVSIGLIVLVLFYLVSYYSYSHFDNIFISRIGAKLTYHKIFKWNQRLHALNKIDTGFTLALISCYICFLYNNLILLISSISYFLFMIIYVIIIKLGLRKENKFILLFGLLIRLLFSGIDVYGIYSLFSSELDFFKNNGKFIILINISLVGIFFIFQVIGSVICTNNFGKGLRNMMEKQVNSIDMNTTINSNDE